MSVDEAGCPDPVAGLMFLGVELQCESQPDVETAEIFQGDNEALAAGRIAAAGLQGLDQKAGGDISFEADVSRRRSAGGFQVVPVLAYDGRRAGKRVGDDLGSSSTSPWTSWTPRSTST